MFNIFQNSRGNISVIWRILLGNSLGDVRGLNMGRSQVDLIVILANNRHVDTPLILPIEFLHTIDT